MKKSYGVGGVIFFKEGEEPWPAGQQEGYLEGVKYGAVIEAKNIVLKLGWKRFGPPAGGVDGILTENLWLPWLERLIDHVGEVSGWKELLETP